MSGEIAGRWERLQEVFKPLHPEGCTTGAAEAGPATPHLNH